MQLLVAGTAPKILRGKFKLVLLILLQIFQHNVINVTAELTCHQCQGINCLRTNYVATHKCFNDLDICVNIYDGQTLLAQGCYEQLPQEFRYKCDNEANNRTLKKVNECFKCNEILCNKISSSFECIQCDSDTNKNCLTNPLSLMPSRCNVSRTPNEYCFVKSEGAHITRGCFYSLQEQMSCLNSDDCMLCQPSELNACNNIEFKIEEIGPNENHSNDEGSKEDFGHGNERLCHQCSGINCLRTSYAAEQKCLNNEDICVTVFDSQTVLAQGCWELLTEDERRKCDKETQCLKCNKDLCNSLASKSFECIQCDSKNDDNCRINPLDLVPSSCNISRTPNEYCFVKQDGEHIIRGCSYTLQEQMSCLSSDNCMICLPSEIHGCNNIKVINDDSSGSSENSNNGTNEETNGNNGSENGNSDDENKNDGNTEEIPSGSDEMPEENDGNNNSGGVDTNPNNGEGSIDSGSENGSSGCITIALNTFIFANIICLSLLK